MASEMSVKPGFFGLPLDLFKPELYEKYQSLIDYCDQLLEEDTPFMVGALHNLQGMYYYSIRQNVNALTAFNEALKIDGESLNSLENLRYIYERLGRSRDARITEQRLQGIVGVPVARARCLAEQGFALGFGVGQVSNSAGLQRHRQAVQYYTHAITLAGDHIKPMELAYWHLGKAAKLQYICDQLFTQHDPWENEFVQSIQACLTAFKLTQDSSQSEEALPKALQAHALRSLGIALSEDKFVELKSAHIQELLTKYNAAHYDSPEKCFKDVLELDPDNPQSCTRYAKVLFRQVSEEKVTEDKNKSPRATKALRQF
jgi:tetratricopeptide (TPR) repeat protein